MCPQVDNKSEFSLCLGKFYRFGVHVMYSTSSKRLFSRNMPSVINHYVS